MRMKGKGSAEVRGASSNIREQATGGDVVRVGHDSPRRPIDGDLQIQPTGIAQKARISEMRADHGRRIRTVDPRAATRKRDERQPPLREYLAQLGRPVAELREHIRSQLNAAVAER